MSKLSKKIRSLIIIKFLIKQRFILTKTSILFFTIIYLKIFKHYKKLTIIATQGKGAGFYATAYLNEQKFFLKIANRRNSSKNEAAACKIYHRNSDANIKLFACNYSYIINYISFYYVKFVNLHNWMQQNHKYQKSFLVDLIEIAAKLKRSRVNHKDINLINIAVIKDDSSLKLELFDFGISQINSKNFTLLFEQDMEALSKVAAKILTKQDFNLFKSKIALL